jgi:aspartate/methionine/tyrosine aminotransferase
LSYEYVKPSAVGRTWLENYRSLYGQNVSEMDRAIAATPKHTDQIDLTHGDTRAFVPPESAFKDFTKAVHDNTEAYSAYRGSATVRELLAPRISKLISIEVDPHSELIITPGSQGALFSALSAFVGPGTVVAFPSVEYFMYERIVSYLGGQSIRIPAKTNLDGFIEIEEKDLEAAHKSGASVLVFSNPNNPTGGIYRRDTCERLANWAKKNHISVIADQLYCRLIYDNRDYTSIASLPGMKNQTITLLGPSKTESMSGYRLGVAVAQSQIINSMESILSMTSLRTAGYAQHALTHWLAEDGGWLEERVMLHQEIRDYLVQALSTIPGVTVSKPGGSSYIFPSMSETESINGNHYENDFVFTQDLKLAGVLVSPGYQSGIAGRGHFRINFSQNFELIKTSVPRIQKLVKK